VLKKQYHDKLEVRKTVTMLEGKEHWKILK